MSARDAWREVCMVEYRISGDILKATAFADSVENRIRAEVLREAAERIRTELPDRVKSLGGFWAELRTVHTAQQAADLIDPEVSSD